MKLPFSQPEVIDDHNIKVVEMKLENVHIYIHWTHISNQVYRVSCCAAAAATSVSVFHLSFLIAVYIYQHENQFELVRTILTPHHAILTDYCSQFYF